MVRIRDSVIVVTGASSGIGRATALALARRHARTVLVARDAAALAEVADESAALGGEALVAALDVTDAAAVEDAASRAIDCFGRLDGWVNAASVTAFGPFLDIPLDDFRRVLDVNLMGYVHGCRAALPRMIERGQGVVVNLSSVLGVIAQPYGAPYVMSKFGLRGLGVTLRQELRLAGVRGVEVCTVLPAAIDTPIWRDAANRTGRRVRPLPPVHTPERVARIVVNQLRRPRREVVAGGLVARAFVLQHKVMPGTAERLLALGMDRLSLSEQPQPGTSGNLYRPPDRPRTVRGGGRGELRRAAARAAAGLVRRDR